jgi:hypothetical protein
MNANIESKAMNMHVVSRGHVSVAEARRYLEAEARRRRIAVAAAVFIATTAAIVAAFI